MPRSVKARIVVEAGSTFGWHSYTGREDDCGIFGLKDFGASAPAGELYKEFGFTTERVVQVAKNVIKKNKK